MDRDGHNRKRLAVDADLPVAPVWSPDGVIGRLPTQQQQRLRRALPARAGDHLRASRRCFWISTDGVLPVDFAPDGSLYFTRLSTAGTDLGVIRPAGGVTATIAHLSDDFARDWHLSPDGTPVGVPGSPADTTIRSRTARSCIDLNPGAAVSQFLAAAAPASQDAEFNPIWRPDGREVTIGRLASKRGRLRRCSRWRQRWSGDARARGRRRSGFDVPLVVVVRRGLSGGAFLRRQLCYEPGSQLGDGRRRRRRSGRRCRPTATSRSWDGWIAEDRTGL